MEHARLKNIWAELDKQERELKIEQKHLSDIWLKVCEKHKKNEDDRAKLEGEKVDAGLKFVDPEQPIKLNVGGQIFETTAGLLCKDEYSVLAGICRGSGETLEPRMAPDESGSSPEAIYIDRDWWIFRHILQFLRTGMLPDDPVLIEELYNEATFYRLGMLRESIEKRRSAYHIRARRSGLRTSRAAYGSETFGSNNVRNVGRCDCSGNSVIDLRSNVTTALPGAGISLPDPFGFTGMRSYGGRELFARTWG